MNSFINFTSMDSAFFVLNNTSQLSAHENIFARFWLRVFGALFGESTLIYRLVSSAKGRIGDRCLSVAGPTVAQFEVYFNSD